MKGEYRNTFTRIIEAGRNKKLNRRNFLHQLLATGLTVSAANALWINEVLAQTPQRGGKYRVGVKDGNTSDSHDPRTYSSSLQIQLAFTHRSCLTEITSENGIGPDMADSWEASPDATTWTFLLNKDAVFHSGKPFTSKDAVASLNLHRGETTSAAAPLLAEVTDIQADGNHAIKISLNTGYADLPWILADHHFVMLPANADGTVDWESGDGSGPYRIVNHEAGILTNMVRHDGWHREGAYFDEVDFLTLNDSNARQSALITGDVDAVTAIDLKTMNLLARNKDIAIDNVPSGAAMTMPMFCDHAPFDNNDVRLALKYAINREDIIEKILFGMGSIGNDFHVSPNMPYWPNIEQRQYDPDKAKFHLKNAGLDSLEVNLSVAESVMSGAVDLCVLFGEHAKPAGIKVNTVREPSDGYWSDVWLKKPFVFVQWGSRPTPDNMFTLAYKSDAAWNESHWNNERFNELLLAAKAELNNELRAEMYREMCQISRDEGGTIIPGFINYVSGRRANVEHGPSLASNTGLDGGRSAQRWWFAS